MTVVRRQAADAQSFLLLLLHRLTARLARRPRPAEDVRAATPKPFGRPLPFRGDYHRPPPRRRPIRRVLLEFQKARRSKETQPWQ